MAAAPTTPHTLAAPLADRVITAPRGRAAQMNAGARDASGDVLLFLHADTVLPEAADLLLDTGLATNRSLLGPLRCAHRQPAPALTHGCDDDESALAR